MFPLAAPPRTARLSGSSFMRTMPAARGDCGDAAVSPGVVPVPGATVVAVVPTTAWSGTEDWPLVIPEDARIMAATTTMNGACVENMVANSTENVGLENVGLRNFIPEFMVL